jgi:hypothetical protein
MARRLRIGALQESDFQAFGNPSRFNPGGNRSSLTARPQNRQQATVLSQAGNFIILDTTSCQLIFG